MSWKGSNKFGGLMERIFSISCCIKRISNEDLGTWLSSFRHFIERFLQGSGLSSCSSRPLAMTRFNSLFKIPGMHKERWSLFCFASIIAIMWWKGECNPKYRSPKSSNANALANEPSAHMERKDPGSDSQPGFYSVYETAYCKTKIKLSLCSEDS